MEWVQTLRRWTMRGIHAAILGAALLGSARIALAQPTGTTSANLPKRDFARSYSFDLPVVMDQEQRARLSEIRLYVKSPTGAWKLHESIAPHQTKFACKVAQDGEYWFLLAIVDKAGKMEPADLNREVPSRRVVVDTTAPVIQVQPWTSPEGDFALRCTVNDANPDHASLKAVCKTAYGTVPLERVPNQPGAFRIMRVSEPMQHPVVITMKDMAGNVGMKEVNVGELLRTALGTAPAKTSNPVAQTGARNEPAGPPTLPAPRFETPPLPSAAPTLKNEPPAGLPTRPDLPAPQPVASVPPPAPIAPPPAPIAPPPAPIPAVPSTVVANKVAPPTAPGSARTPGAPHQLINTTRASVDFRIDHVGPSGVGKIDIYMTPDKGQTWHRLSEVVDKRSPTEINLPGDGEYGIRLAVTNGNGFGGKAPARGEAPHYTIEVDTTSPFVQLRSTELIPGAGHLELRWNAQDKNLGTEPVSLFYRTKADGPWQVIARKIKNDGVHRWVLPRDAGGQFFFKIEVTDQAGNLAQDLSRQPVTIDMSEPHVTVVNVTGSSGVRQTGN